MQKNMDWRGGAANLHARRSGHLDECKESIRIQADVKGSQMAGNFLVQTDLLR